MSVNLLLDKTGDAEAWKNLKVNNLVVNGNLTVDGSIIQPNNPSIEISSDFFSSVQTLSSQFIPETELAFSNYSAVLPQGLTFIGDDIILSENGNYIINIQLELRIQTFTVDTLFNLILWDNTSSVDIANCEKAVGDDLEFTLSVNRVAFLEAGKHYRIQLKQSTAQNTSLIGTNFRSYMNIVKLF